jgi:hypothetical protein
LYCKIAEPALRIVQARDWQEVPCQIIASRVQQHEGSDGASYSVDVLYEYVFDDRRYHSSRYDFIGSGYAANALRQNPAGSQRVCYVDPKRPTEPC